MLFNLGNAVRQNMGNAQTCRGLGQKIRMKKAAFFKRILKNRAKSPAPAPYIIARAAVTTTRNYIIEERCPCNYKRPSQ